ALDVGLAAQTAFGADLAGHAGHLGREGAELVHHGIDRVLQLQDLALHRHRDLLREVAARDRGGHLGDVADLVGEVAGHEVDAVGEVLPGAGHVADVGLAAQLALGAHLAGHARHLGRERAELVHHGVDRVLQLQDLALHLHRDLLGEVAPRHRLGDVGDVADLAGEVAGHEVDAVGEILPGAGHALDVGLAPQPALGADLAGHASDLGGERAELADHDVDHVLDLEDLAAHVHRDALGQVARRDRGGDLGDVAQLNGQVTRHQVHAVGEVFPGAGHIADVGLTAQLALGADLARDPGDLGRERAELVDHGVDFILQLEDLALDLDGDLLGEVAGGDGLGDVGDVADLAGEVAGREVDVVAEVLPGARDPFDSRLTAQAPFGADLAGHAGHLRAKGPQLVHHGVDRVLPLEELALDVHRDLLGEVAVGDRGRHLCDVPHLARQVAGHRVDAVGEVLPGPGHASDVGPSAELAFGPDFAHDTGDLRGERA